MSPLRVRDVLKAFENIPEHAIVVTSNGDDLSLVLSINSHIDNGEVFAVISSDGQWRVKIFYIINILGMCALIALNIYFHFEWVISAPISVIVSGGLIMLMWAWPVIYHNLFIDLRIPGIKGILSELMPSQISALKRTFKKRRDYPYDGRNYEKDWAHTAAITILSGLMERKYLCGKPLDLEQRIKEEIVDEVRAIIRLCIIDTNWYEN